MTDHPDPVERDAQWMHDETLKCRTTLFQFFASQEWTVDDEVLLTTLLAIAAELNCGVTPLPEALAFFLAIWDTEERTLREAQTRSTHDAIEALLAHMRRRHAPPPDEDDEDDEDETGATH